MYGTDSDNALRVLTRRSDAEEVNWNRTGSQSPAWLLGSVTVSKTATEQITVSIHKSVYNLY